jgi:imidazole glycerol-phosphate synthase subunit HisF
MLCRRIIPCLDIKEGRTVKGIQFKNLIDAGDPIELAKLYCEQGADELAFLDITATIESRTTLLSLVSKIAQVINIPFTVGGGISTLEQASNVIKAGADKVALNSAAIRNPKLIDQLSVNFGSQCIVVAVDSKMINGTDTVVISSGKEVTDKSTLSWVKEATERGAGEILLTSMDNDGTKNGFAVELTRAVVDSISIPVIASGGAGSNDHFYKIFERGEASAALAASVFHFEEIEIKSLKNYLSTMGIPIRDLYNE